MSENAQDLADKILKKILDDDEWKRPRFGRRNFEKNFGWRWAKRSEAKGNTKVKKSTRAKKTKNKQTEKIISTLIIIILIIASWVINKQENKKQENQIKGTNITEEQAQTAENTVSSTKYNLSNIPEYTDKIYTEINNNIPYFKESEHTTKAFENYSQLDSLKRCGVAYANICKEIMPTEKRGDISNVKPTGWKQAKYDGKFLYNRCHLIGYQLAGENANELNLITGTNYFNVEGMLPFENKVAEYIEKNNNNHVLYRVTPDFKGDNKVASGVEMEAYSVEDNGQGVSFNVYVYNVQPGITINYQTGESSQNSK